MMRILIFIPLDFLTQDISDDLWIYDSGLDQFVQHSGADNVNNLSAYGIDPGDQSRYELGFYASGYYKFNLMENVSVENILNLYSNYLEDPQNVDLDYTL